MAVSETERRAAFFRKRGIECVYACSQTHSRNVAVVDNSTPSSIPDTDGLITQGGAGANGLCLSVTVADCLPVYLFDRETGAYGVVHSGWKGTGIALDALRAMNGGAMDAQAESLCAVLGPCICGECYHVDEERLRIFSKSFKNLLEEYGLSDRAVYPLGNPVKNDCIDIRAANICLLASSGVRHIAYCENCTFTDERLGSFRREGSGFTKMAAAVTDKMSAL